MALVIIAVISLVFAYIKLRQAQQQQLDRLDAIIAMQRRSLDRLNVLIDVINPSVDDRLRDVVAREKEKKFGADE